MKGAGVSRIVFSSTCAIYAAGAGANVLAEAMHPLQMTKKVRVRCGRCSTVNVAVTEPEG